MGAKFNVFYIFMLPFWRRRYFCASVGILLLLFYLYVLYATDRYPGGSKKSATDINFYLTGSLSAKLPIDINIFSAERKKYLHSVGTTVKQSQQNIFSAKASRSATFDQPTIKASTLIQKFNVDFVGVRIRTENKSESLFASGKKEYVKKKSRKGTYSPDAWKSLKQRFSENGIKPTSIAIKSHDQFIENTNSTTKAPVFIPSLRLVHFDLKGAPPKVSYFSSIFPLIKAAGANGIIMEYEDTFPFWGPLAPAVADNAYKRRDIKYILEKAKINHLIVIPLIQTFGHLEFVLKLEEFKHLREVSESPQALCPTNNGSLKIIKTMIDQVLSLHSDSKQLHIGSDEVFQLGQCKRCSRYERNSLFLTYVQKVAKYIKEYHGVSPIMWDDMLRHISVQELEKYELGKLVEPMAWTYVEDVYSFLPDSLWEKYRNVFPYVWSASAFKGAFGETLTVPDVKRHLENNKAWLTVMSDQSSKFQKFRGIALTGWQRYDHFAALCELLPAALPSLILTLLTVSQGRFNENIFPKAQDILDCSSRKHYSLDLKHDPHMWHALGVCFFPGSAVFRLTLRHNEVSKTVQKFIYDTTVHKGWMTSYNVNHNFTSPFRVNELLKEYSYHNTSLRMLSEAAAKALREVFDDYTTSEWIELNIFPLISRMQKLWEDGTRLKSIDVWPRRPLPKSMDIPPRTNIDSGVLKS